MSEQAGRTGSVAVGVSGAGSNLRALAAAADRGELGGEVALVFADRACPALDWAMERGIETALIPGGDDGTLAETLGAVGPDVIVLAGYMRIIGPAVLAAFAGRIVNTHPSLLPAFPGAHSVADAIGHGVAISGCTVHLVDERSMAVRSSRRRLFRSWWATMSRRCVGGSRRSNTACCPGW